MAVAVRLSFAEVLMEQLAEMGGVVLQLDQLAAEVGHGLVFLLTQEKRGRGSKWTHEFSGGVPGVRGFFLPEVVPEWTVPLTVD